MQITMHTSERFLGDDGPDCCRCRYLERRAAFTAHRAPGSEAPRASVFPLVLGMTQVLEHAVVMHGVKFHSATRFLSLEYSAPALAGRKFQSRWLTLYTHRLAV